MEYLRRSARVSRLKKIQNTILGAKCKKKTNFRHNSKKEIEMIRKPP